MKMKISAHNPFNSADRPLAWYEGTPFAIQRLKRLLNGFDDGGVPKGVRIKVRKGYKLVNTVYKYGNLPGYIRGKEVVQWVQTYWADDAEGDDFQPIIKLSSGKREKRRPKRTGGRVRPPRRKPRSSLTQKYYDFKRWFFKKKTSV